MSGPTPTERELNEHLSPLVEWTSFALHLPRMDMTTISEIKHDHRYSVKEQKLALYQKWLTIYPSASWTDVVYALEKAQENRTAHELKEKLLKPQTPEQATDGKDTLKQETAGATKPSVDKKAIDIKLYKKCIKDVMIEQHAAMRGLIECSIKDFAAQMYSENLITPQIHRNPSFESIMECFIAGFDILDELKEVQGHCGKFFSALYNIGGPLEKMANKLKKAINEKLQEKMNLGEESHVG